MKVRLHSAFGQRLQGVILYGSEARREADDDSDIDLLVLLTGPVEHGEDSWNCIRALYPLVLELERPIHAKPTDVLRYEARIASLPERETGRDPGVNARAAQSLGACQERRSAVAKAVSTLDPDSAASRAYYAAFYAVSARFVLEGKEFSKHSAVETAVHRDLVKAGIWPTELGQKYSQLSETRSIGDYGEIEHVSEANAAEAIQIAEEILATIAREHPHVFTFPQE